jgi:hypothetical protein
MKQLLILTIVFLACVPAVAADDGSHFIAYYFHGERRCKTCRTIEAYAEEAVRLSYGKQIEAGTLEWQAVNMEKPENEHFVKEFGLTSSSVVLVEMKGGKAVRHEILEEVWFKVRDRTDFFRYVREEIRDFLG